MLGKMKKKINHVMLTIGVALVTSPLAMAASGGRILQSQGDYLNESGITWIMTAKSLMFLAGLIAIGFSSWQIIKDYVIAKSDHEKKFSPGVLAVGMIVGSLLCYPGGAALIGGDFTGAGETITVETGDFERGN